MFNPLSAIANLFPQPQPDDFLPFEPEFASQYDPADLLGEAVWVRLYDTSHEQILCWVEDTKTIRGTTYALFVPVNGRCERWRLWECAVELG